MKKNNLFSAKVEIIPNIYQLFSIQRILPVKSYLGFC